MMISSTTRCGYPNPRRRAVRMALAISERVAELIRNGRELGYGLDLSIGIAQGYATIGAIGFEGRSDYGAIGSVADLAARLCAEAKPGEILILKTRHGEELKGEPVESAGELSLRRLPPPDPGVQRIRTARRRR